MARSEARIRCAVWRNRDFTALPLEAQGLYWMLLSQPDVSLAGVVPYNPQRWSHLTPSNVDDALEPLVSGGFVAVDYSTGELWIRTFPKHDGVLASPKTQAGMWSAWRNILSDLIRAGFIEELEQKYVDLAYEKEWVAESEVTEALESAPDTPSSDPLDTPSDTPPDRESLARADSDTDSDTDSTTLAPAAPPPASKPPAQQSKHPELFQALMEVCGYTDKLTKSEGSRIGTAAKELREVGATPDDIKAKARAYRKKWPDIDLTPTALSANWNQIEADGKAATRPARRCRACDRPLDAPNHDRLCAQLAGVG